MAATLATTPRDASLAKAMARARRPAANLIGWKTVQMVRPLVVDFLRCILLPAPVLEYADPESCTVWSKHPFACGQGWSSTPFQLINETSNFVGRT